jgi:hypothetical protein
MMQAINLWPVAAALALLALFATLRLSIPHARTAISGYGLGIVAHPAWLMPVMLGMPMAVGFMMTGALSPWPPEAAARADRRRMGRGCGLPYGACRRSLAALDAQHRGARFHGARDTRQAPYAAAPQPAAGRVLSRPLLSAGALGKEITDGKYAF